MVNHADAQIFPVSSFAAEHKQQRIFAGNLHVPA